MERRTFLNWVGVGMLGSFLPVAIAACQSDGGNSSRAETERETKTDTPPMDTSVREDGFQVIGTVEKLEEKGVIVDKKNAPKPVTIFRHPETNELVALNSLCTHKGCNVQLNIEAQELACPCHGSKFALDGKVVNPPATENLEIFEVKQEDNLLLVKVG